MSLEKSLFWNKLLHLVLITDFLRIISSVVILSLNVNQKTIFLFCHAIFKLKEDFNGCVLSECHIWLILKLIILILLPGYNYWSLELITIDFWSSLCVWQRNTFFICIIVVACDSIFSFILWFFIRHINLSTIWGSFLSSLVRWTLINLHLSLSLV